MPPPFDEAITTTTTQKKVLVAGLEGRFEGGWKQLAAVNWGACEGVGEESPYVRVRNVMVDVLCYGFELGRLQRAKRPLLSLPIPPRRKRGRDPYDHLNDPHHTTPQQTINDAVRAYVPSVRALLSQVYFRNFCDKFAQVIFFWCCVYCIVYIPHQVRSSTRPNCCRIYSSPLTIH